MAIVDAFDRELNRLRDIENDVQRQMKAINQARRLAILADYIDGDPPPKGPRVILQLTWHGGGDVNTLDLRSELTDQERAVIASAIMTASRRHYRLPALTTEEQALADRARHEEEERLARNPPNPIPAAEMPSDAGFPDHLVPPPKDDPEDDDEDPPARDGLPF